MSERLTEDECDDLAEEIEALKEAEDLAEQAYQDVKDELLEQINDALEDAAGYDLDDKEEAQEAADSAEEEARDAGLDEYFDNIDAALDELEAADAEVEAREADVTNYAEIANELAEAMLGDTSASGPEDSLAQNLTAYLQAQEDLQDAISELTAAQSRQADAAAELARLQAILEGHDQDEIDELQEAIESASDHLNEVVDAIAEARQNDSGLNDDMSGHDFGGHSSYEEPLQEWMDARSERSDAEDNHDQHCGDGEWYDDE